MGARILYVPKCSEEGCRGWQLKMDLVPVRVFGRGASSLRLLAFGSRDATFDLKCDTVCAGHTKAGGIAANLAGMACLTRSRSSLSPEAWLSRCICGRSVGRGGRRVRRGPGIWLQAILRMLVALAGRQVDLHNDDKTCCNSIV
jgi:hypothetical protein